VSDRYLVERYWPGVDRDQLVMAAGRLGTAAHELAAGGRDVRVLSSVLIPADEVVLSLFEAASEEDVVEVNRRSGVPFDRVQPVELYPPQQ
jgi:hypothetical protein